MAAVFGRASVLVDAAFRIVLVVVVVVLVVVVVIVLVFVDFVVILGLSELISSSNFGASI